MEHKQGQRKRTPTGEIVAYILALGAALEAAGDRATAAWSANQIRTRVPALSGSIGAERTWQLAVVLAVVGLLLLVARQRASERIGEHGLKLVRGFGVLALILAVYMGVLSQTGFGHTTKLLPRIRAEVPQLSTAYPEKGPSPAEPTGGGEAGKPTALRPEAGGLTASTEPRPKPSSTCPCGQKPSPQKGKPAPSGGATPRPTTHETQASIAKTKEESVNSLSTETKTSGGSGSAKVEGGTSSEAEISGGAGSIKSEHKSSSSTSSSSSENGSTQTAEAHSTEEGKAETKTG